MANSIFNKDGMLDLSFATKFEDVATTGCTTIIRSDSGDRTKFNNDLMQAIGTPKAVNVYFSEDQVIVVPATEGTKGSVKLGKGDVIYNSRLAAAIMKISGGTFPENKSTRTGTFTVEKIDENTPAAVISFGNSSDQTADAAHKEGEADAD